MPSQADTSLFVFHSGDFTIYMLVYVDDIVIVSSSALATQRPLQQLSASFPVKDLGPMNYFLGIKVASNSRGMLLTQHKYAQDILCRVHLENSKHVSTPLCVTGHMSRDSGVPLSSKDVLVYHSTMGALHYITLTRPDLSFDVNKVCQFLSKPTDVYWEAHSPVC
jgi:hypothetical protein